MNQLISENYDYLCVIGRRITGDKCKAIDLVSETYLWLKDNRNVPSDNNGFIKFFCKSMHNQYRWERSDYNKNFRIHDGRQADDIAETNEQINTDEILSEIQDFKKSLPPHEERLFVLYFEFGKSLNDIARDLSIFGMRVHARSLKYLIAPINYKLKNKKWRSLNLWAYSASPGCLRKVRDRLNSSKTI